MFARAVLFAVLTALIGVSASPLPMPAVKNLAARYYNRYDPVWIDGTPCWRGGQFGYLKDRNCDLIKADVDVGLLKRHGGPPFFEGSPCWNEDKFGSIEGAVCVVAEVQLQKKDYIPYAYGRPVWLDGTPCWQSKRFGYLKDKTCSLVDIDVDINLLGLGKDKYHQPYFVDGTPCWSESRFGYIYQSQCSIVDIDADISLVKKRDFYPTYSFGPDGRPVFADGSPCYEDGRFGYFENALCIVADLDIGLAKKSAVYKYREPVWTDGTPCWRGGRFGHLKDKTCGLVDADIDIGLKRKRNWYPDVIEGGPCWNEDRFGYIRDGTCLVDIDLDVATGNGVIANDGIVGGLLTGPHYRYANAHPGNVPPPKPLLGVAGLKRKTAQPAENSKRGLLTPLAANSRHGPGPVYRPGYFDDDDVVADLAADLDLGKGRPLGLRRGLGGLGGLGNGQGLGGLGQGLGALGGLAGRGH